MRMGHVFFIVLAAALISGHAFSQSTPELLSVKAIWEQGEHNAFTDLIYFSDRWFCVFREATGHVKGNGTIRIISSVDGEAWESTGLLSEEGIDLRDPKICLTADNRLTITMGGSLYKDGHLLNRRPRVSFSSQGNEWTAPSPICEDGDWLWRTTWHKGTAYGVAYSGPVAEKDEWELHLKSSEDGLIWRELTKLEVTGKPNETTLRFQADGTMMALIRREAGTRNAWFGLSKPPYTRWEFKELEYNIGGPNFLLLPDGSMIAAGRRYEPEVKTALGPLTTEHYAPVLELPSGGDTSYPGLVWHDELLWVSYYASHEGKSKIYLAKIKL